MTMRIKKNLFRFLFLLVLILAVLISSFLFLLIKNKTKIITIAEASISILFIRDDATGGDCYLIGNWDPTTKTCTLTTDVYGTIQIDSDYITLDGANYKINGPGIGVGLTHGIYLSERTGVAVKNLNISNFWRGITIEFSHNNIIVNNFIKNNGWGIYILASSNNKFIENTVIFNWPMAGFGLQLSITDNNLLERNIISNNLYGLFFRYADKNLLIDNTIRDNVFGIGDLIGSDNNKIYNNNFVDNQIQIIPQGANIGNIFNLEKPVGGNYWSNFNESNEGCNDVDNDKFCDYPYYFTGGVDYLPWTKENGWRIVPAKIDIKPDTLNKLSKGDRNAVTAYIEIPDYNLNEIDVTTITLTTTDRRSISAQFSPIEIGDYDNDGILDLMVKFKKQALVEIVEIGDNVKIIISGKIGKKVFEGTDEIKVI